MVSLSMIQRNLALILLFSGNLFVIGGLSEQISATRIERPFGVPLEKKILYDTPGDSFECFDGSRKIPKKYINDDFCDCPDASDEPGTAACQNGKFYCANRGYVSQVIKSSRVNDGICDCCDAADEWGNPSKCNNTCLEQGKHLREEAKLQYARQKAGYEGRKVFVEQAAVKRAEKEKSLNEIHGKLEEIERLRTAAEENKNVAETVEQAAKDEHRKKWEEGKEERAKERERVFVLEMFNRIDENKDALLSADEVRKSLLSGEEHAEIIGEAAALSASYAFEQYLSEVWPKFRDAINPVYFANAEEEFDEEDEDAGDHSELEEDEDLPGDIEGTEDEEFAEYPSEEEVDKLPGAEPPKPAIIPDFYAEQEPAYDEETNELVTKADMARTEFNTVDTDYRQTQQELEKLKKWLENDYDHDAAFAALEGQCVEVDDREYVYSVCLFGKVTQKNRNGGSDVNLGEWGAWLGTDHRKMRYEKGTRCWNGPERSTTILIECGESTEILSVSEPSMCVYEMSLKTPAACQKPPSSEEEAVAKALGADDDLLRHLEL